MRVGIVGSGRAAGALARGIAARGGALRLAGVHSRSRRSARALVRALGTGKAFHTLADLSRAADVIVLAVPDGAIAATATALASAATMKRRSVLHLSGALGPEVLGPLRRAGASVGGMHPLLAFPPAGSRAPFPPAAWFGVGGDRKAAAAARRIARHLRGRVIAIPDRARPAWHLAAVLVANHSTALAAIALDVLERRGGLSGARVRGAFASLLRSAADGIEALGPQRALSGPASRGDLATLRAHLDLLGAERPELRAIYRALSSVAADLARKRGDLDAPTARRLLSMLRARGQRKRPPRRKRRLTV